MIKLIVSDLDGTLLPYGESEVSKNTKALISEALESGFYFAVSSGRTYGELIKFLPEFEKDIYFICCDGAYYLKNNNLLYGRAIGNDELSRFFGNEKLFDSCIFHGAFSSFSVGDIPLEYESLFSPVKIERRCRSLVNEKIYKITSLTTPIKLPPYSALRVHWSGDEGRGTTQYVNRFCNKGASLSDLEQRLFLSRLDVAVLGDAENDIPMFKGAGLSFSVGNRSDAVIKAASHNAEKSDQALSYIVNMKKQS